MSELPATKTRAILSPRSLILGLMAAFLLLDQAVKIWLQQAMQAGESWPVLPEAFHITLMYNTGAAFSMFNQYPHLLLAVTGLIFGAFLFYSMTRHTYSGWQVAALGLLLGGALGNIVDRLLYGKVVDYLDLIAIHYPVFNLADSFIFCGIVLLILQQLEVLPGGHD